MLAGFQARSILDEFIQSLGPETLDELIQNTARLKASQHKQAVLLNIDGKTTRIFNKDNA